MKVFEQNDYKIIINYLINIKSKESKGQFRKIAEHINVNPSLISQILSGPKDFSEEQIIEVCEYLGVSQLELEYLLVLLKIDRSSSVKLKNIYLKEKQIIKDKYFNLSERIKQKQSLNELQQSQFYSSWSYQAIHLYCMLDKKMTFEDIQKKFNLAHSTLIETLNFLTECGLIEKAESFYIAKPLTTHLHRKSAHVKKAHTNWRIKSIQNLDQLSDEELAYSSSLSINKKDFAEVKLILLDCIQKILAVVDKSPPEDIAQINMDLFWIKS